MAALRSSIAPGARGVGASLPAEHEASLEVGSVVAFLRRSSWPCPLKCNPSHRKDVNVGKEGVILRFEDNLDPVVRVVFGEGQAQKEVAHVAKRADLMLAEQYRALYDKSTSPGPSKEEKEAEEEAADITALAPKGYAWLHHHIEEPNSRTPVEIVPWTKYLGHKSDAQALHDVKASASWTMAALSDVVPAYSMQDFVVAHRHCPIVLNAPWWRSGR